MKSLPILGFAIILGFLAPVAQAAPVFAAPSASSPIAVPPPAPTTVESRPVFEAPQAAPGRHETDRAPRTDSGWQAPSIREHHQDYGGQPVIEVVPAPDTDDSQDTAPSDDDQSAAPTDDSCSNAGAYSAHYSMDDLVNAMQNLDSSY